MVEGGGWGLREEMWTTVGMEEAARCTSPFLMSFTTDSYRHLSTPFVDNLWQGGFFFFTFSPAYSVGGERERERERGGGKYRERQREKERERFWWWGGGGRLSF